MEPETINQDNSVTDLLALRLSSVPFHDIDQTQVTAHQPSSNSNLESHSIDRWVPQVTTISFVGQLHPLPERQGFFKSSVPLLNDVGSSNQYISFLLVLLPNTVVVGTLPELSHSNSTSNWLISGELCVMSGEFTIAAQSIYGLNEANDARMTSQISFTGYVSSIVAAEHVTWLRTEIKTSTSTVEEAIKVAEEPEAWHSADICSQVSVSLADLEWLDVSIEIGVKSPDNPSAWIRGASELISVKSRPSKTKEDHTRFIEYATTVPLVGQLIAIDLSDQNLNNMKTFFVQL